MDRKIRVGAVSYLNTKPLLYGIERSPVRERIELITEFPARIARMLIDDEIDLGLVPVAVIPRLQEYHINTDWCIGADGPVASVCLFSEVPLAEVKTVLLDYQSRTSVALARILFADYWRQDVIFADAREDFRNRIGGTTAGVVIGDRALEQRRISPYHYDLAEAWKKHTGLPFVFAAWISNKELDRDFVEAFDRANAVGVANLEEVLAGLDYPVFDLRAYYTNYIHFRLDAEKRKGLALFLQKLGMPRAVVSGSA